MFICGMWTGFYQVLHQEFLYGWPNGSEISDVDSGQIGVTMACWRVLYISLCPVSHVLQKKYTTQPLPIILTVVFIYLFIITDKGPEGH